MRMRRTGRRATGIAFSVAAAVTLSACASTGEPGGAEGASVREGRNTSTPSGGLVPGQWPHGF